MQLSTARRPRRRADVAFAVTACAVLAGYNNLVGLRPWHRRWYPAVNCAALLASSLARTLRDPNRVAGRPVDSG